MSCLKGAAAIQLGLIAEILSCGFNIARYLDFTGEARCLNFYFKYSNF